MPSFKEYMESALYAPGEGYYPTREPRADFYTAPELSGAFARVLARDLVERLESLRSLGVQGPLTVVEMGASGGLLSRQALESIAPGVLKSLAPLNWVLVERVPETLIEGVRQAGAAYGRVLGYTRLRDLPAFSGVLFSNELVDAFPVHVLEKSGDEVRELCVGPDGETYLDSPSDPALAPYARLAQSSLAPGERASVNLEAERWIAEAAARLQSGFLVTVDYGKRFKGLPPPPRAFYRHTTIPEVTDLKGRMDLTSDVDFESLIAAGSRRGLELESFETLSAFLLRRGIDRELPAGDDLASALARAKVKALFHPEGMGEAYKVLIQSKGLGRA